MIYILNQSSKPWDIISDEKFTKISMTTAITYKGKPRDIETGISISEPSIPNNSLNDFINMKDIVAISENRMNVSFDPKTYVPSITQGRSVHKDIVFASLNIEGKKIVDVICSQCFLLKRHSDDSYLHIIATLNNPESELQIMMQDNEGRLSSHTFVIVDSSVKYTMSVDDEITETLVEKGIKIFRPNRMTEAVLISMYDNAILNKITSDQNIVYEFGEGQINTAINKAITDGYSAITFIYPGESKSNFYSIALKILKRKFKLVYTYDLRDNKIHKIKVR